MKVMLLSDVNSSHTQQWALNLVGQGLEIGIFSLRKNKRDWAVDHPHIQILYAADQPRLPWLGLLNNFDLFTYSQRIRRAVQQFQPDLLHAHGVGNHGLIAAIAAQHPLIISAWGSDIMAHPHKSILHRYFVRYALRKADRILATSLSLAKETEKYTTQQVIPTPFGIDLQRFSPSSEPRKIFGPREIVFGSVKGLKKIYQHDLSLKHFAALHSKYPDLSLRFLLVGDGVEKGNLQKLAEELKIGALVEFAGSIAHQEVPKYLAEIDVLMNLSIRESFGVAVLEASAMQIPVITSDVGGLPEVVVHQETGFFHSLSEEAHILASMEKLALDAALREEMGKNGRAFVARKYAKDQCTLRMIDLYENLLHSTSASSK